MKRNRRTLWFVATGLSLSAFSFAAGFGIRNLASMTFGGRLPMSAARLANYTQVASAAPGAGAADPDLRPAELYKDVYNKLHVFYVEPLPNEDRLAEGSISEMLAHLKDANTRLMTAHEWEATQDLARGSLHGLGAVLTIRDYADEKAEPPKPATGVLAPRTSKPAELQKERNITVVAPLPGSAAEKAGLQPGDRITHLDGHWIAPMHLSFREMSTLEDELGPEAGRPRPQDPDAPAPKPGDAEREKARVKARRWIGSSEISSAMEELTSGKGAEHELTVQRPGTEKPFTVKVKLADGQAETFSARKINPTTGYVRIATFTAETPNQVEHALSDFEKEGVQNLVVDLRHSGGGSLEAAVATIGLLAPGSTALISKERDTARKLVERKVTARGSAGHWKPNAVSVLVDGGTAGSSEVLAAALHDNRGAKMVGSQTFGDGTEEQVIPLSNGDAISITHAHMLTPKGTDFDDKGLKPDVPAGPGDLGIDAAVKALPAAARPTASARNGR